MKKIYIYNKHKRTKKTKKKSGKGDFKEKCIIRDRETFCNYKGLIRKTEWSNVYSPNNALR